MWNRTRRLQVAPFLARTDTNTSRRATAMATTTEQPSRDITITVESAKEKKQDTLFGPNIGIVAKGPEWTESREKVIDELTPDIVRGWIAKSKEVCNHFIIVTRGRLASAAVRSIVSVIAKTTVSEPSEQLLWCILSAQHCRSLS